MAFSKIILNGTTLIDLSQDTVTSADHIVSGHVGHLANGTQVTGTASDDFIITVSYNSTTEKYEPNKTFAEVQAAYSNGKNIVVTSNECLCVGSYDNEHSTLYIEVYNDGYNIGYGLDSQGYQELYRASLVNTQNANATASDVLDGVLAFGANGAIWGTIPRRTSSDIGVSDRTVTVTNGYYASNISVNVATGTAGTPSATKGTVSNHQVSITPSVTNTTGYITGGTKTGTAVSVSASELVSGNKEIISNGTNIDVTDYETVTVNVPDTFVITVSYNSTTEKYEPNKTFAEVQAAYSNGKNIVVTSNECLCVGSYDNEHSTLYIEVYNDGYNIGYGLDSQGYQELYRASLVNTQNANATASDVLDGVLAFGANGAIWGTIPRRTSSDIGVSDRTVTVTNGYYASNISVNVATGTAGTPSATKGTVSNHQVSITPSVTNTTGYITGGTKTGTAVTVSASELVSGTLTVDSSGTKDVTNYASASIPAGTAGTPSASKGTVSNHQISVTPSVTNTTGWITGDTKTGTAVTVTASELASGNKAIAANGTDIDVVGYSTVSVAIPVVTYYTGSSNPSSSTGSNGDIYLKTN